MKVSISLHLPEPFRIACETMGIQSDLALQRFINHIYVYAFVSTPGTDPASIATNVFVGFLTSLGKVRPVTNPVKREIGIYYSKKIMRLIGSDKNEHEKEEIYQTIMDQWFAKLRKMDRV